jgi:hypothetical protein
MLKKPVVIVLAFVISVVGILVYFHFRLPPGVQPMGDGSDTVSWVALATAVVSMLTAIFGLVQKIVELKGKNRK